MPGIEVVNFTSTHIPLAKTQAMVLPNGEEPGKRCLISVLGKTRSTEVLVSTVFFA